MVQELVNKIPKDKLLHFVAGVLIYSASAWLIGYWAIGLVVIAGVGKEVYDYYYGGTEDVYDALVTIAGGVVVLVGGSNGI